ncbi:MAG: ABC transporter permease [Aquificaceae bacterium]|nr:ABC transporter permease [Aquificaceae bacterium]MDW8237071.1 ABC transporter permease [Aquificaceae bacterium]
MLSYIILRLIQAFLTLIGVSFISFLIIKLAPGDYLDQLRLNPQVSQQTIELLKSQFGLDRDIFSQFIKWLISALSFDLGYSFQYHAPVSELILDRIPATLFLSLGSAILSWIIAIPLGFFAGIKEGSNFDRFVLAFSYTFMSVPSFFLAFIFLLFVSQLGILPVGGMYSPDFDSMSLPEKLLDLFYHMSVPLLTLSLISSAGLVRLMRSSVIELKKSPFLTALRAKGLKESSIRRHLFKNALNPFITLIGFEIASLLSGSAVIEIIFGWPGLGSLMLDAVLSQDLYLVMGGLYIGTILLLLGNFIADILLAILDPRIKDRELTR